MYTVCHLTHRDHLHPTHLLPDGKPSLLQAHAPVNERSAHLHSGQLIPAAFTIANWTRKLPWHGYYSAYFHLMGRPFSHRPMSQWVRGLLIHIVDSSLLPCTFVLVNHDFLISWCIGTANHTLHISQTSSPCLAGPCPCGWEAAHPHGRPLMLAAHIACR